VALSESGPDSAPNDIRLPVWRLITGLAVLGILVVLLGTAAVVYVDNFRLDQYVNKLAAEPSSAGLSDSVLTSSILERAKQLNLPVRRDDVSVTRTDGRPHFRIAGYGVQTYLVRMDLRLPEATSH